MAGEKGPFVQEGKGEIIFEDDVALGLGANDLTEWAIGVRNSRYFVSQGYSLTY